MTCFMSSEQCFVFKCGLLNSPVRHKLSQSHTSNVNENMFWIFRPVGEGGWNAGCKTETVFFLFFLYDHRIIYLVLISQVIFFFPCCISEQRKFYRYAVSLEFISVMFWVLFDFHYEAFNYVLCEAKPTNQQTKSSDFSPILTQWKGAVNMMNMLFNDQSIQQVTHTADAVDASPPLFRGVSLKWILFTIVLILIKCI